MKTKIKIISAVISSVMFAGMANAEERNALHFLSEPIKKEVALNDGKEFKVKESDNSDLFKKELRKAEAFIDPEVSAKRSQEMSQKRHELEVAKIDMQRAEFQEQVDEINAKRQKRSVDAILIDKEAAWEKEKAGLIESYEDRINELKSNINYLKSKLKEKQEIDNVLKEKIFVTKVSGIGHNLKARVYYENNIATRRVGDEVIPGAIISQIEQSGIHVSYKGEKQFIPITTTQHAHYKTFEMNKSGKGESLPPELNSLAREVGSPVPY